MHETSREIDRQSERVLRAAMRPNWELSSENPDTRHVDFRWHAFLPGESVPRGPQIDIQLKGTRSARLTTSGPAHSFDVKHLIYWIDEARLPVFLVLADLSTGRAYFRSVHDWHMTEASENWRGQKSATVHFCGDDVVDDHERFLAAVDAADLAIRELRPGSPRAAVISEQKRLAQIDPRFVCRVTATASETRVVADAREAIEFKVQLHGENAVERFRRAVEVGGEFEFHTGEITFPDDGLFAEIANGLEKGSIRLALNSAIPCEVELTALLATGTRSVIVADLRAKFEGGTTGRRLRCSVLGGILLIEYELDGGRSYSPQAVGKLRVCLDLTDWIGKPLLELPYFERVQSILDEVERATAVEIALHVKGRRLPIGMIGRRELDTFASQLGSHHAIRRLSECARHLGINPVLPDLSALSEQDLNAAQQIVLLCEDGPTSRRCSQFDVTGELEVTSQTEKSDLVGFLPVLFMTIRDIVPAELFGAQSPTHLIERVVGPIELDAETRERLGTSDGCVGSRVVFRGRAGSSCTERMSLILRTQYDGPHPPTRMVDLIMRNEAARAELEE